MLSSAALVEPTHPHGPAPFSRSDSVTSSIRSAGSASALQRRSRTRTRSSIALPKRGRSQGPPAGSSKYESDAGESFLDFDDVPPVPTVHDEPEEMTPTESTELKKSRRRSRTIGPEARPTYEGLHAEMPQMPRSWSALDMRNPPPQPSRGRQAKSDNGSVKAAKLRGMSLPRQSFRPHTPSDCSSQPSPQTPYGFGEVPPVQIAGRFFRNNRDSMMTHNSSTSSSVYPASTSAGTRTESSMPYTDDQDEAEMSFPEIVTPEHPDFDPDDVSNRLRLLLNNSYFLPPAHTKPTPLALSPNAQDPVKKSKSGNAGFLDFFRIGKSKSKPVSPVPGSPPALDGFGPILRTTSDTPTASGLLLRPQPSPLAPSNSAIPPPPPVSRVVVLRERMDDLASAAKEAEKELRNKADSRKTKSQTTPRGFVDDVIDPTDAVDLPPPSADSIFAVQASAVYGLGPQDSVGAAVLAERLVPNSPGVWSISSDEDVWRKELLREAVSHSLNNTPDHSFSSSISSNPQPPLSPPAQSEASFPTFAMLEAQKPRVGQRILEDLSMRTESSEQSLPPSPTDAQQPPAKSSMSSGERSPRVTNYSMLSTADPPARAETPAHLPLPLAPPPRKVLVNPLYSLSQPDLPEAVPKSNDPSPGSSSASYHTVRKSASTPGFSGAEDTQRAMVSLSPPPLPEYRGSQRGISPDSREISGMPSFSSTGRSRTESDSRYSSDSMSFRTPMDTDVDQNGARPSMSMSVPSGRPSVSVSEYSMPSPTASAFRDAVFGSCRPPSVMSRRSTVSRSERPQIEEPALPPAPPVTPRTVAASPPPRISSSASPTILPVPPRPRAARPLHRPSTSTRDTRSSGSRGQPSPISPGMSEMSPAPDTSASMSFSSSSMSPTVPLAARRGFGSALALSIPGRVEPPAIHSAPAPASPTDFFDRIQSTIHNAMDDLDTSDESESEDDLSLEGAENARSRFKQTRPGESPSTLRTQPPSLRSEPGHIETAAVFVEPRTQAISNRMSSSSARPSIMRLGNHSTPQLSPASYLSPSEPLPQFSFDRKKPIGNVIDLGRRSFTQSRSPFKGKGKGVATNSPLLPIGAMPSSPIGSSSFGRPSVSSASSAAPTGLHSGWSRESASQKQKRPATATGAEAQEGRAGPSAVGGRKVQRESILRFDGMLVQHLAAEKDRMKRITNDYATSSSTSSPVQVRPSGQLPLGR